MKIKRYLPILGRISGVLFLSLWAAWLYLALGDKAPQQFPLEKSFGKPTVSGYVAAPELREISGLAAAAQHQGCSWTHNDSGDDSFIYLIDSTGRLRASCQLAGVSAYDWEEIALTRLPQYPLVLVGDIGDNHARRRYIEIHLLAEPTDSRRISRREVATLQLTYADGARDAEAMLVDIAHNELLIITKRGKNARIYATPLLPVQSRRAVLTFRGELPFNMITAASLSPDGMEVVMKNYRQIFYWKRRNLHQSLTDLLQTNPHNIDYLPELQGEAIAWANSGKGFFTATERPIFMGSPLVFYGR